jgi:hypothetical protein
MSILLKVLISVLLEDLSALKYLLEERKLELSAEYSMSDFEYSIQIQS